MTRLLIVPLLVLVASLRLAASADVHPWSDLLGMSWLFYEAQQSGVLPAWNRVTKSNGGWRDNSHMNDGKGPGGVSADLSGGFYDAGDHMKYHLPLGHAMSTLAMGALVHEAGYRSAGQWDAMARNMAWAGQYLIKSHLQASDVPTSNIFVGQVGDTDTDHNYWGRPERQPEGGVAGTSGYRPVWTITSSKPGSDILGSAAASMAGISMVLRKAGAQQNLLLAADLLRRAKQLLAAGVATPGRFSPSSGSNAYTSGSHVDDLAWGALMICWADLTAGGTGMPPSCSAALTRFDTANANGAFSVNSDWDNVFLPTAALLTYLAPDLTAASGGVPGQIATAKSTISNMVRSWQQNKQACTAQTGDFNICYTPGGLAFLSKWGSLRHTCNIALVTTVAAAASANSDLPSTRINRCWARSQLLYAAGTNTAGQSFIVGYAGGSKLATSPHHRSSSCDPNYAVTCDFGLAWTNQGPNPSVLRGALVGGPSNQDVFVNDRQDFVRNEVALDFNSGFTGTLAALTDVTARLAQASCSWSTYCAGGCDSAPDSTGASLPSPPPSPPPTPPPSPMLSPPPSPPPTPPPSPVLSPPPSPPPTPPPSPVLSPPPSPSPFSPPPLSPSPPSPSPLPPPSAGFTCAGQSWPNSACCSARGLTTGTIPTVSRCATCTSAVSNDKTYACVDCLSKYPGITDAVASACTACVIGAAPLNMQWACAATCADPTLVTTGAVGTACGACVVSGTGANAWGCKQCLSNAVTLASQVSQDVDPVRLSCMNCVKVTGKSWECSECLKQPTLTKVNQCLAAFGV